MARTNGQGDGAGFTRPVPHVVIVGGGFGGLETAKGLGDEAVRVTVVDRKNHHLFQPLLYQVALAGLSATDIAMPIRSVLSKNRNTEVMLGDVQRIDLDGRRVFLADGGVLDYDFLVLAAGAKTSYFGHDEWEDVAPGLKTLDDALEIRRRVLLALEAAERSTDPAERRRLLTFVIIGGGPTGVELAGAIADLSRDILFRDFHRARAEEVRIILLEMADRVLTPFTPDLSEKAAVQLEELGVEIRTGTRVTRIDRDGVHLDGQIISAGTVLWGAGVAPSPLTRTLGVALDRGGRVLVEQDNSIPGHPEAFAIGDLASLTPAGNNRPLPGISPVAIQQGRTAAANILRTINGEPRKTFEYFDKGFMATIGKARAVAMLGKLKLAGLTAWLAWVFVHLWYLVGFRNRISVFVNWIWSYLMARHGARLVTGPNQPWPIAPPAPGPTAKTPAPRPSAAADAH